MISRLWHGWTTPENADAYENLLRSEILPGIESRKIDGFRGAHLLRRQDGSSVEFLTICWFDSWEAVREFAGDEHEVSVVPPKARKLLDRFDHKARHYDLVLQPLAAGG